MKNWRPISLINVDTKIASKALAARMENVLTSIVHCNQTAYVKNRYIGESIRLITDLLAYTEENSIGGILLSADFEKAFDSIEHSFIFATLKSFGFGAQFIQWIRTIFNSTESFVINNCHSTGFSHWKEKRVKVTLCQHFFSSCGSRHCSYKFVINETIKGININTYQIKLSAYADDADFLASDAMSLELILQTCANFQTFSSLKLNVEKCEACWIGAEKDNPAKPINCKWVNIASEAIRTLAIYNSYDTDLVEKLNYLDNLKPLNDVIRTWESRGLSLAGKILVFKTLAVSQLLYVCTFKNPSTQIIESLNSIQKKFIWSKKRPKIKHSRLIADYKDGGYKDIDIETKISSLKVKWVSRLLDDNFHPWKIIPNLSFSRVGGNKTIFHFNLQLSEACLAKIKNFPLLYQQLIQIWAKVSKRDPTQTPDPAYEICKYCGITAVLHVVERAYIINIL